MLTFLFRTVDGYRVDTVTDAAEFPFADNFSILQRLVAMYWEDVRILSPTSYQMTVQQPHNCQEI